jgi:hypothetical protein
MQCLIQFNNSAATDAPVLLVHACVLAAKGGDSGAQKVADYFLTQSSQAVDLDSPAGDEH